MRRIITIAGTFVVGIGVLLALVAWRLGPAVDDAAAKLYRHRGRITSLAREEMPPGRHVLWMGDSTILPGPGRTAWASAVARQLRQRGIASRIAARQGQDQFHHFCVLQRFLASDPGVVVLIVNMRFMAPGRRDGRTIDLCSHLPPSVLLRSVLLPWHDRGVTVVRVGLARALGWAPVEQAFLFLEGVRRVA